MRHGYEPSRITTLTQQSRWALGALDAIHSTDSAAAGAMTAVAGLRAVIADRFIPATTAVGIMDPLGGSATSAVGDHYWDPDAWADRLFEEQPNDLSDRTDDELLRELIDIGTNAPFEAHFMPDHPYWDEFQDLADEIARRAIDEDTGSVTAFGRLLLDNIWQLPALPVAISIAEFDPRFSALALTVIFDPDRATTAESHRSEAFGADLILATLIDQPGVLSDVIQHDQAAFEAGDVRIEDTFLFQIMDSDVVDQQLLGDAIGSILGSSGTVDLADIERSLSLFVQIANATEFKRGFSEPVALALALAVIDVLPQLEGQIRLEQTIYFDDLGEDDALLLGEYADVRDFIGAILVNPAGLVLLLALADEAGEIVSVDGKQVDVQAFAELLRESFAENLAEIDIANARSRAEWGVVVAVLTTVVGLGPVGKSLGTVGGKFAQALVKRFGAAAATATADRDRGQDVGHLAQIMILFGSYEGFLDAYSGRLDPAEARRKLAAAWDSFEAGAPLGEVAESLHDVAEEIETLGGRDFLEGDVADAIHDIDPIATDPDL